MASVEWSTEGLDSLDRLDAWRLSQGWEAIALEILAAVEREFARWDPYCPPGFVPGRPVHLEEGPTDLRVAAILVRSKPFRVYFRCLPTSQVFEVLRVLHPRAKA